MSFTHSLTLEPQKKKEERHENEHAEANYNFMKSTAYTMHKKHDLFLGPLNRFPAAKKYLATTYSALEYALGYGANYVEEKTHHPPVHPLEAAVVDTAADLILERYIGGGPVLSFELIGSAGKSIAESVEPEIAKIKSKINNHSDSHTLEHYKKLWELKTYAEAMQKPKAGWDYLKHGAVKVYDYIKNSEVHDKIRIALQDSGNNQYHPSHASLLFADLSPESTKVLDYHSDYLLQKMKEYTSTTSMQELIQHPGFNREIDYLRTRANLSEDEAQLFVLHTGNRYAERSSSPAYNQQQPNLPALKTSLSTLRSAMSQDLSKNDIYKSRTIQALQRAVDENKLQLKAFTEEQKTYQRAVMLAKIEGVSTQLVALSGLGSQIASLGGDRRLAAKFTSAGSGIASGSFALKCFATGNPVMGFIGLGSAVCSFMGLFDDDDDDDNGLTQYLDNLHQDMMQGFNQVINHTTRVGIELAREIDFSRQENRLRFDHIDKNLYAIQEQMSYAFHELSAQQAHISQQVSALGHQLNETQRNILMGLQAVHSDLTQNLKMMQQGLAQSFTLVSEQLTKGLTHLDNQVQVLNQELRLQMAQQTLVQKQYFLNVFANQQEQRQILLQQAEQLQAAYKHSQLTNHRQLSDHRKWEEDKHNAYAQKVLRNSFSIKDFDLAQIEQDLSQASNSILTHDTDEALGEILGDSQYWENMNPFDFINLLRRTVKLAEFDQPLVHIPTWQTNVYAYLKWLLQQEKADPKDLTMYAEQGRQVLRFCHALAQPTSIQQRFEGLGQAVDHLAKSLEIKLESYQELYLAKCKDRLSHFLGEEEIRYAQFKDAGTEALNEIYGLIQSKKEVIKALQLSILKELDLHYPQALTCYAKPASGEKIAHCLALHPDKWPKMPEKILALEALGAGSIAYYYRHVVDHKRLEVSIEFHYAQESKTITLAEHHFAIESSLSPELWQQLKWPATQELILSADEKAELDRLYDHVLIELRLQMNYKLRQDLLLPALQKQVAAIDAQAGILHLQLKLLFETFIQGQDPLLTASLASCMTSTTLDKLLAHYTGQEEHPAYGLNKLKPVYQKQAELIQADLEKRILYVNNLKLNQALLLIDNAILKLLKPEERVSYLNDILASLPEEAKANYYLLRASLQLNEQSPEDYQRASDLHPDDNLLRLQKANYLSVLGRHEEAVLDYTFIIEKVSEALDKLRSDSSAAVIKLKENLLANLSLTLMYQGDSHMALKNPSAANQAYTAACKLYSEQPDLLAKLGLSNEYLNNQEKAFECYQAALKVNPEHALSMEGMGRCLVKTNQEQAFHYYLRLSEKFPQLTQLKLHCAILAPENDKRIDAWLMTAARDANLSTDDSITCAELLGKRGRKTEVRAILNKVADKLSSKEQGKRCVVLIKDYVKDMALFVSMKKKELSLPLRGSEFSPPISILKNQMTTPSKVDLVLQSSSSFWKKANKKPVDTIHLNRGLILC